MQRVCCVYIMLCVDDTMADPTKSLPVACIPAHYTHSGPFYRHETPRGAGQTIFGDISSTNNAQTEILASRQTWHDVWL